MLENYNNFGEAVISEPSDIANEIVSSQKKYYVIAYNGAGGGLFAIYSQILWQIVYALDNGYIPVVDLKHYYNQYFKDNRTYKDNSWEYFFKQPCGVLLDDLNDDCDVIISKDSNVINGLDLRNFLNDINKSRETYKKYFGVIEFQDDIKHYLEEASFKITGGNYDGILGILCRGTDYINNHPYRHPVQPKPETVIQKAKELISRFNYKRIWLATEDLKIYNLFRKEFGDMIIENPYQYRFSDTGNKWLADINIPRENHNYNLAKEYLLSIYILSKCPYIIGGRTAGIVGCWLLSNGFEKQKYVNIWNLGLYGLYMQPVIYANRLQKVFSIKKCSFENHLHWVITILNSKIRIPIKEVDNFDKEYIKMTD